MAKKSRNNFNIYLLVCALIGAALFYGCGGVSSDQVPEIKSVLTGYVEGDPGLGSSVSSIRGSSRVSGAEVWVESDYGTKVLTDQNGKYTLVVKTGEHRVVSKYNVGNTYYKNISNKFLVEKGETHKEIPSLELIKADYVVTGKLSHKSGSVTGVTATLWGEPFVVNPDGTFETPPLPIIKVRDKEVKEHSILITGGGFQEAVIPVTLSKNSPQIEYTLARVEDTNRSPYSTLRVTDDMEKYQKNSSVYLEATFGDPDSNISTYSWEMEPAGCGTFSRTVYKDPAFARDGSSTTTWRTPTKDMLATITFRVVDTNGLVSASKVQLTIGSGGDESIGERNITLDSILISTEDSGELSNINVFEQENLNPILGSEKRYKVLADASTTFKDVTLNYSWAIKGAAGGTASGSTYIWRAPGVEVNETVTATLYLWVTAMRGREEVGTLAREFDFTIRGEVNSEPKIVSPMSIVLKAPDDNPNANPRINIPAPQHLPTGVTVGENGLGTDDVYHIKTLSNVELSIKAIDEEDDDVFYRWWVRFNDGSKEDVVLGDGGTLSSKIPAVSLLTGNSVNTTLLVGVWDKNSRPVNLNWQKEYAYADYAAIDLKIYGDKTRVLETEIEFEGVEEKYSKDEEVIGIYANIKPKDAGGINDVFVSSYTWILEKPDGKVKEEEYFAGAGISEFTYTFIDRAPGTYKLKLVAEDNFSQVVEKDVTFGINMPPTIKDVKIEPEVFGKYVVNIINADGMVKAEDATVVIELDDKDDDTFICHYHIEEEKKTKNLVLRSSDPDIYTCELSLSDLDIKVDQFGAHEFEISVEDAFNEFSASKSLVLHYNSPPTVTAINIYPELDYRTAYSINETLKFSVETDDDEDGSNSYSEVRYFISKSAGTSGPWTELMVPANQFTVDHSFEESGTYRIAAIVKDFMGGLASATIPVTVVEAPEVNFATSRVEKLDTDATNFLVVATIDRTDINTEYIWERRNDSVAVPTYSHFSAEFQRKDGQAHTFRVTDSFYPATYTLRLTVNNSGNMGSGTFELYVNQIPELELEILEPEPRHEDYENKVYAPNQNLVVRATAKDDDEHDVIKFDYKVTKKGNSIYSKTETNDDAKTDKVEEFTTPANSLPSGIYNITCKVTDAGGQSVEESFIFVVGNKPDVKFEGDNKEQVELDEAFNLKVKYEGSELDEFQWDADLNGEGYSSLGLHSYTVKDTEVTVRSDALRVPGSYTIRVTAKDIYGETGTAKHKVYVNQIPDLEISIESDTEPWHTTYEEVKVYSTNDVLKLKAVATDDDRWEKLTFSYKVGNGNFVAGVPKETPDTEKEHTFNLVPTLGVGEHTITCKVTDDHGGEVEEELVVIVANKPVVTFKAETEQVNKKHVTLMEEFQFEVTYTGSDVAEFVWEKQLKGDSGYSGFYDAIHRYEIYDKTVYVGKDAFDKPGTYTIRVTAIDKYGATDEDTYELYVNQIPEFVAGIEILTPASYGTDDGKALYEPDQEFAVKVIVKDEDHTDPITLSCTVNNGSNVIPADDKKIDLPYKEKTWEFTIDTMKEAGDYTIKCVAKDSYGKESDESILHIKVAEEPEEEEEETP